MMMLVALGANAFDGNFMLTAGYDTVSNYAYSI